MKPLVSVILPVHNGGSYIAAAIESILSQTYDHFELIVINDASTDNTGSIVQELAAGDKRIRYLENETNLRVVQTLNKGITLAEGKYIARMDADDIALPDRFETQVGFLEANTDIGIADVLMEYIDEKGESLNRCNARVFHPREIRKKLAWTNVLGHSSIMGRAELFKAFRYDNIYYEDYELWLRMTESGVRMAKIDRPLLRYRIHTESITAQALNNGTHFRKLAATKARFLRNQLKSRSWSFFCMRVFGSMVCDYLLYFYKKLIRR